MDGSGSDRLGAATLGNVWQYWRGGVMRGSVWPGWEMLGLAVMYWLCLAWYFAVREVC